MSFNREQFRDLITRVLKDARLYSEEAVELLMGTAAQESHLGTYLKQVNGPALGVFQMEPETEYDIWENYLKYREHLKMVILALTGVTGPSPKNLETNLAYQILMARIHYLRVPSRIPDDPASQADYWKRHYNSVAGKGKTDEYIHNYNEYAA